MGWLIPRLDDIQRRNPSVAIRLDTSVELVDFSTSEMDIAIRHTNGPQPDGLCSYRLFDAEPMVVCAPVLAKRLNAIEDRREVTLLHSATHCGNGHAWLRTAGVDDVWQLAQRSTPACCTGFAPARRLRQPA